MRRTTPSTERPRRFPQTQTGQAIVFVALTLVVIIGFLGLAVDGGRAYWERRMLQNAVDAAALAASDNYQDSISLTATNQAAAKEYAANQRITGTASASPAWASSSVDVTWTGSTDRMHISGTVAGTLATFDVSSSHTLPLAFMSVLGAGTSVKISAAAQGRARTGGTSGSGIVLLSQGSCSGGAPALSIAGGATINVTGGNVQSNGSVSLGSGTVTVSAGKFSDNCTNPVPAAVTASGGKFAGVAPVVDPAFPPGPLASWTSAQSANSNVVLQPGIYASDMGGLSGACYFLAAGVYQVNSGFNSTNSYFSNELRAPNEAAWVAGAPDYKTNVANPQWWGSCAGSFSVAAVASAPSLGTGKWGVMLTSTRTDYYPAQSSGGTAYPRESAPSTCREVSVGAGQGISVTVNNAPGATGYNVYMSYQAAATPACTAAGPWGYVGNIPNPVVETQASRGTVSATFNATTILTAPTALTITAACAGVYFPNCAAATGQFGSANPPGDGGETAPLVAGPSIPPGTAARDVPGAGGGDRANEHYCMPAGTSSAAPCANATVTPGAVQLYFPGSSCYSFTTSAVMRIFSGYQYNWMGIYAPVSNTCSTQISDSASVVCIGTYYWPGGTFNTNGNPGYLIYFTQIVVNAFASNGNENLTVSYDVTSTAPQGFSQISG